MKLSLSQSRQNLGVGFTGWFNRLLLNIFIIRYSLILVLLFTGNLSAIGLEANFGVLTVENLMIGGTYNLTEVSNLPLKYTYKGKYAADIVIEIQQPLELKPGYEPIPDVTWINIEPSRISVGINQEITTTAIIKIPNDEKLMGKKFHANLVAYTELKEVSPDELIATSIKMRGHILLTIAPRPPTAEELEKITKNRMKGNLGFELRPTRIILDNVDFGKKIDVEKEFKEYIRVVNTSDEPVTLTFRIVTGKEKNIYFPPDYTDPPAEAEFKFKKTKIKVKPDNIERVKFYLKIPKKDEFRGKKYIYIVEAESTGASVNVRGQCQIWIHTK